MIEDDKIPQGSSVTEKEPRMFKALRRRRKTPAERTTPPEKRRSFFAMWVDGLGVGCLVMTLIGIFAMVVSRDPIDRGLSLEFFKAFGALTFAFTFCGCWLRHAELWAKVRA